jgi:hypothetical protein
MAEGSIELNIPYPFLQLERQKMSISKPLQIHLSEDGLQTKMSSVADIKKLFHTFEGTLLYISTD